MRKQNARVANIETYTPMEPNVHGNGTKRTLMGAQR